MSVEKLLKQFEEWMRYPPEGERSKGEKTRKAYLYSARKYLEFLGGAEISRETAREFVTELEKSNGPRSIGRHLDALNNFFKSIPCEECGGKGCQGCYGTGHLRLRITKPGFTRKIPRWLNEEEREAFLDAAKMPLEGETDYARYRGHMEYAMAMTLMGSGARVSEMCTLLVEDVHRVSSTEGTIKVLGKNAKERQIPVEGEVIKAIEDWLRVRRIKSDYVFPGANPDSPITPSPVERIIKAIGKRAGLDNVHPHTLRHTAGTAIKAGGGDLQDIQNFLGHSRIETTAIYTHMTTEDMRKRLPNIVGKSRKKKSDATS